MAERPLAAVVVRNTASRKGRTQSVTAGPVMQHLHYGRIILDAGDAPVRFETGERETALVCLRGAASIAVSEARVPLGRYDAIYVPRDATVAVVGHEPTLSRLLARMLGVHQDDGRFAFKKGGAALLDLPDGPAAAGQLRWFVKPRILRSLGGA